MMITLETALYRTMDALPHLGEDLDKALNAIIGAHNEDWAFNLILLIVSMGVGGWLVETIGSNKLSPHRKNILQQKADGFAVQLSMLVTVFVFDLIAAGLFILGAAIPLHFLTKSDPAQHQIFWTLLVNLFWLRFAGGLVWVIFSPSAAGLRLVKVTEEQAMSIYKGTLIFAGIYALVSFLMASLFYGGMRPGLLAGSISFLGLIVNLSFIGVIWFHRRLITELFSDADLRPQQGACSQSALYSVFAQIWPFLFTIWMLGIWVLWTTMNMTNNIEARDKVTWVWYLTLFFPLIDRIFNGLLRRIVAIPYLQTTSFANRSTRFIRVMQSGFRVILFISVIIGLSIAFYGGTMVESTVGQKILFGLADLGITILLAYILWEVAQTALDKHMPKEESALDSLEGEGGGGGASRQETLAPLLRSFIMILLGVTVILTGLSALGVDIAPLLAGAGVVGIAIGFGAQKLVQDIISGIFFLVDDAFRRGEYIEAGGLKGTVEKISLRSMRLRHHLGAVQTLPYSEIATVKNLSRDWVTMKLEFRLPYDVDVDKVRKIVKKVGIAMQEDEVMGPNILLPLKSQGVIRIEESALIFRMKFTTKPGEQWVVRREAYRKVKDALAAQGIHFAHRQVTVAPLQSDEPEAPALQAPATPAQPALNAPQTGSISTPSVTAAPTKAPGVSQGAAAAIGSELAETLRRNDKISDDGEFG